MNNKREKAIELIKFNVKNNNLIKHMLATEAVMKHLSLKLDGDKEIWGITGLVHDIDVDLTKDNPEKHGDFSTEILEKEGFEPEIIYAVRVHVDKEPAKSLMDKALYATDPLTGFITACALMTPTKKLADVNIEFAKKRFKEKRFAAGASREQIQLCSNIGLTLEEFIEIGIKAMQEISDDLGL